MTFKLIQQIIPIMSENLSNLFGAVHGITLTFSWFIFTNVGLWALKFKHHRAAIIIHIACMCAAAFLMAFGPIMMIVQYGPSIITASWTHELWGFITYCILPIILISGALCKFSKDSYSTDPKKVYFLNKAHTVIGWFYIIIITPPLLTGWYGTSVLTNCIFGLIIFVDVVSWSGYLYLKFFGQKIGQISIDTKIQKSSLRSIKSLNDLKIYSENYFIFANYVYNLTNIISNHPGGWKIIEQIRTREVDRFMYGVDPIELYDVPRVDHSEKSIQLAGQPIAKLSIPSTYSFLEILNEAKISEVYSHNSNMKIHTIYLKAKRGCKFTGYQSLSQLGQYYSLTLNKKFTRLYTAVNFLQKPNIELFSVLGPQNFHLAKHFNKQHHHKGQPQEMHLFQTLVNQHEHNIIQDEIPLLIKKYDDGKFTSYLLDPQIVISELLISQPRGLGLALDTISQGNISILAGGTGLYPFSDLIDLLFKAKAIEQKNEKTQILEESNPVLKQKPFKRFTFSFYVAINDLSDMHPITLYQLNEISKSDQINSWVKIKEKYLASFQQQYPNISELNTRFQNTIGDELKKSAETTFYICGPVKFTRSIIKGLQKEKVEPNKYKII